MKRIKKIISFIAMALGFDSKERRHYVDEGLLDFSGQGRDKYGK